MPDDEMTEQEAAVLRAKAEAEQLSSSGGMPGEEAARLAYQAEFGNKEDKRKAWNEGASFAFQYGSMAGVMGHTDPEGKLLPAYIRDRNPYGPEFPGTTPDEEDDDLATE